MTNPRGTKISIGEHGYVQLVDFMGDDKTIVNAARVSFGRDNDRTLSERDRKLIHYLMQHRHTTPFEHVTLTFKVCVPMDTWRQWVRHRTASINEYSTRYSPALDIMATTKPDRWRKQSESSRQGSSGEVFSLEEGTALSEQEAGLHELARMVYFDRINKGVAREQARKDLPLSTYTEAYWTINLHNLFHFLELRMSPEAQLEIRNYAYAIFQLAKEVCPEACVAFGSYYFNSKHLNSLQLRVLCELFRARDFCVSKEEVKKAFDTVKCSCGRVVRDEEYEDTVEFLNRIGAIKDNEEEND